MLVAEPGHEILSGQDADASLAGLARAGLVVDGRPVPALERVVALVVGAPRRLTLDVNRDGRERAYRAWVAPDAALLGRDDDGRLELALCEPREVAAAFARRVDLQAAARRAVWPEPLSAPLAVLERALAVEDPDATLREATSLGPLERAFLLRAAGSPRLGWKLAATFASESGGPGEQRLAVVDAGSAGLWTSSVEEGVLQLTAVGSEALWQVVVRLCGGVFL
jgi:hypothetical protein